MHSFIYTVPDGPHGFGGCFLLHRGHSALSGGNILNSGFSPRTTNPRKARMSFTALTLCTAKLENSYKLFVAGVAGGAAPRSPPKAYAGQVAFKKVVPFESGTASGQGAPVLNVYEKQIKRTRAPFLRRSIPNGQVPICLYPPYSQRKQIKQAPPQDNPPRCSHPLAFSILTFNILRLVQIP